MILKSLGGEVNKPWFTSTNLKMAQSEPIVRHYVPTTRPISEPPIFDYDDVIENTLPSDIRFSKLFPNDIQRWTRCRDAETEKLLHGKYLKWV